MPAAAASIEEVENEMTGLSSLSIGYLNCGPRNMPNWHREPGDRIDAPLERTMEILASKSAAEIELQQRAWSKPMTETLISGVETDDAKLAEQVRMYISLRDELMERGKTLVESIGKRRKTLIVAIDDGYFEVSKSFSGEMPLRIVPAEVLYEVARGI